MSDLRADHAARLKSDPVTLSTIKETVRDAVLKHPAVSDAMFIARKSDRWLSYSEKAIDKIISDITLSALATTNPRIAVNGAVGTEVSTLVSILALTVRDFSDHKEHGATTENDAIINRVISNQVQQEITQGIQAKFKELGLEPAGPAISGRQ